MTGALVPILGGFINQSRIQRLAHIHIFGYVFRQKLYDELLSGGKIVQETTSLFQTGHHVDIWYLSLLPCLILFLVRDLSTQRVFDKLRSHLLHNNTHMRIVEFVTLVLLIVFTKDVENVL